MDDTLSEMPQTDNEVDDYTMYEDALLLKLPPAGDPLPTQITLDELRREQDADSFCHAIRSRLNRGDVYITISLATSTGRP